MRIEILSVYHLISHSARRVLVVDAGEQVLTVWQYISAGPGLCLTDVPLLR